MEAAAAPAHSDWPAAQTAQPVATFTMDLGHILALNKQDM